MLLTIWPQQTFALKAANRFLIEMLLTTWPQQIFALKAANRFLIEMLLTIWPQQTFALAVMLDTSASNVRMWINRTEDHIAAHIAISFASVSLSHSALPWLTVPISAQSICSVV
jgi:hypothetical protein